MYYQRRKINMAYKNKETYNQYCANNKEKIKARVKAWKEKNKELIYVRRKEWRKKNKDKLRTINYEFAKKYRYEVLSNYGNKCACCGETEADFLQVDHVNNDGVEHRKSVPSNRLYRWLIRNNFPPDFQILCSNCNLSKGFPRNNNKCVHQLTELPWKLVL